MDTKIALHSADGSVPIGQSLSFTGFVSQAQAYFSQFGHLPRKGDSVAQDAHSADTSAVVFIDFVEYGGIRDGHFVVNISLTLAEPA